jgi:hypothetical protein
MRTFEISVGNGLTEVIDLGDDSPLIKSFETMMKGQQHLEEKIETLRSSLEAQKVLNRASFKENKRLKQALQDVIDETVVNGRGEQGSWQAIAAAKTNVAMEALDLCPKVKK